MGDFIQLPAAIVGLIKEHDIAAVFCRGALAGAIGYLVHRKTKMRYAVESFEPHADYMRESGIWAVWDLRYLTQKYWEKKQMQTASCLMPVSNQYSDFLIKAGVDKRKLLTMPCAVDTKRFALKMEARVSTRKALGLADDVVTGIYVGKFGGLYFDSEAFDIFSFARKSFSKFHLIILSPDNKNVIESKLSKAGYLCGEFHINHIPHSEVPSYLSASDFAFALYKPGFYKRFLSPVKVGEYWASGLPVLLTDGIGDDHLIIKEQNIGSVFTMNDDGLRYAFSNLKSVMKAGRSEASSRIQAIALAYRSFKHNELAYSKVIDALTLVV
jgi:glycosyltransferase involved in cell wall biosynthesis